MAKTHLSLILIKEGVDIDKVLIEGLNSIQLESGYRLYYKLMPTRKPKWIESFFNDNINIGETFHSKSVSAIILFEKDIDGEHRIFAIPFGFGRNLIRSGLIEERFGLLTALSAIDKDKMRSIDMSSLESVLLNSRMQTSTLSGIDNFDVDVNKDLLKSVTGRVEDGELDSTISGRDSLSFSSSATYKTIGREIETYYRKYKSGNYKQYFEWIDKILVIRDKTFIEVLNSLVVSNINSNLLDKMTIAIPDIVDWAKVDHFKFGREDFLEDVDIQLLYDELVNNEGKDVSLEILKSRKIHAYNSEGVKLMSWSVYKCLYVEASYKDKQYFLNEGQWYCIENDFVNEVNSFYEEMPLYSVPLPDYDVPLEDAYNKKLVDSDKEKYFLLDKKLIHISRSSFEVCDVLTSDKKLLHVKNAKGSALLSHLFNQGLVSAECLKDVELRKQINNKLSDACKLDESSNFRAEDYEVVYVIAKPNSTKRPSIPFFSKVSLKNVVSRLSLMGYKCSICGVPFTYVDPQKEEKKQAKKQRTSKTIHGNE